MRRRESGAAKPGGALAAPVKSPPLSRAAARPLAAALAAARPLTAAAAPAVAPALAPIPPLRLALQRPVLPAGAVWAPAAWRPLAPLRLALRLRLGRRWRRDGLAVDVLAVDVVAVDVLRLVAVPPRGDGELLRRRRELPRRRRLGRRLASKVDRLAGRPSREEAREHLRARAGRGHAVGLADRLQLPQRERADPLLERRHGGCGRRSRRGRRLRGGRLLAGGGGGGCRRVHRLSVDVVLVRVVAAVRGGLGSRRGLGRVRRAVQQRALEAREVGEREEGPRLPDVEHLDDLVLHRLDAHPRVEPHQAAVQRLEHLRQRALEVAAEGGGARHVCGARVVQDVRHEEEARDLLWGGRLGESERLGDGLDDLARGGRARHAPAHPVRDHLPLHHHGAQEVLELISLLLAELSPALGAAAALEPAGVVVAIELAPPRRRGARA
mmetsp:Transcript_27113/g.80086  ORF Transcript_27113/g.80086 Transcript_27113/m.80086 type:complete len:440 (+) Transcript_27113:2-1321(+)